jgi:plastocyanin
VYFGRRPGDPFVVVIQDSGPFSPASLDVPLGSVVIWENQGGATEIIRSGPAYAPTAVFNARIAPGGRFTYTFARSGTFDFFEQQSRREGKVVVREPRQ